MIDCFLMIFGLIGKYQTFSILKAWEYSKEMKVLVLLVRFRAIDFWLKAF